MTGIVSFLLAGALIATLAVLFIGIITFAVGGQFSARNTTKLMAARVALQGLAVALFAILVVASFG